MKGVIKRLRLDMLASNKNPTYGAHHSLQPQITFTNRNFTDNYEVANRAKPSDTADQN